MGRLIATEFTTVDGVAQAPGGRDEDRDVDFEFGAGRHRSSTTIP